MSYHEWHSRPGYYRDVSRHFESSAQILDIGCGTAWLSEDFPNYVGLESELTVVERARAQGIDVRPATADGRLPFADKSFDGVILKDVLEHLADPAAMVREVRRVLRTGGRAFASSPDAQRWAWNDYTHLRPYTKVSMGRLWRDQGMLVRKLSYESVLPGSSRIAARTRRKQRTLPFRVAAKFPFLRRNVWILAEAP